MVTKKDQKVRYHVSIYHQAFRGPEHNFAIFFSLCRHVWFSSGAVLMEMTLALS